MIELRLTIKTVTIANARLMRVSQYSRTFVLRGQPCAATRERYHGWLSHNP